MLEKIESGKNRNYKIKIGKKNEGQENILRKILTSEFETLIKDKKGIKI